MYYCTVREDTMDEEDVRENMNDYRNYVDGKGGEK